MSNDQGFWPSFDEFTPSKSPASVLHEAANDLHTKTGNLVGGSVIRRDAKDNYFSYSMYIKAPALGNYTFWLLTIEHKLEMYPTTLMVDDKVGMELEFPLEGWLHTIEATNEPHFETLLKAIFGTVRVRQVVGALITQARGVKGPEDDPPF
jgi:hypothetical protein